MILLQSIKSRKVSIVLGLMGIVLGCWWIVATNREASVSAQDSSRKSSSSGKKSPSKSDSSSAKRSPNVEGEGSAEEGERSAGKSKKRAAEAREEASSAQASDGDEEYKSKLNLPAVVAIVNGEKITLEDLGQDCLRMFGKERLESMVNRFLIIEHCKRNNIKITRKQVETRIKEMAAKFGVTKEQLLEMLQKERHIKPDEYASDIIWPKLALEKLAASKMEVTEEDLQKSYDMNYGPSVRVRMIVLNDPASAKKILAKCKEKPEDFGNLAKANSVDVNSASAKGLIQPIRMHMGDEKFEKTAFGLKKGEISNIINLEEKYIILKCEDHLPGQDVPYEKVKDEMAENIRENKLTGASAEIFGELQKKAKIDIIYIDPEKSEKLPGVAAVVNGVEISLRELAEECVARHGVEALETTISQKIIDQACKKKKIKISPTDIRAELAFMARAMGQNKKDGSPDVEAWLQQVEEEEGLSEDQYEYEVLRPAVALKKLIGENMKITEDDLKKGFEANFGPKVRCLAIVLNNQKKAQEVWEKARKNPTKEFFGDLAAQYSIEAGSRTLRGEVPPIQKNGGQPLLEKEAFALKAGELSGIIQAGADKFVILRSEGFTEPLDVKYEEVKKDLELDILQKKYRVAMSAEFERLSKEAVIKNFLAPAEEEEAVSGKTLPGSKQTQSGTGPAASSAKKTSSGKKTK